MLSFRRCVSAVIISFLALTHAAAQAPPAEPAPPPAPAEPPGPGRFQYGVRFGPSFTTLTSVETFDETGEPPGTAPVSVGREVRAVVYNADECWDVRRDRRTRGIRADNELRGLLQL